MNELQAQMRAINEIENLKYQLDIAVEALKTVKNRVASRNIQIEKDEGELLILICREALAKIKGDK